MKSNLKKEVKDGQKGITLIALIVTIIILIILAGITVGILTSNGNVIDKAQEASDETKIVAEDEKVRLAVMEAASNVEDAVTGELSTESIKNAIKKQFGDAEGEKVEGTGPWTYVGPKTKNVYTIDKYGNMYGTNAKTMKDSKGRKYALPKGATYKEGTVDTGLVITYKGSEFVWIPVDKNLNVVGKNGATTDKIMAKESTGDYAGKDKNGRTKYEGIYYDYKNSAANLETSIRARSGQNGTDEKEPAAVTFDTGEYASEGITEDLLQEDYDAMIESVQKYGGFYVGRYESSLNGTVAASVAGVEPMRGAEIENPDEKVNVWYELYKKQKNFATSSDSVVSGMIWASQWNAMLNWILVTETDKIKIKQDTNGNHSGNLANCGSYSTDKMNNIYDLEGNFSERTMGAFGTHYRSLYGGNYHTTGAPCSQNALDPNQKSRYAGSRMSLYIKWK